MGKCLNCRITVTDNTEVCPLCRCVLEKDGVAKMQYPNIVKKIRKLQLASRIYLLLAIVIEALLFYINSKYDPEFKWSFIPGYLFAIGYITLYYLVYGTRLSYTMDLIIGIITVFSLLDILDSFLGNIGWSWNYVQPGLLIAANIFILINMLVRRRGWQTYLTPQLILFIVSLVAIPLILADMVTQPLVSMIAVILSIVLFLSYVILGGSRSKEELYRKFHF